MLPILGRGAYQSESYRVTVRTIMYPRAKAAGSYVNRETGVDRTNAIGDDAALEQANSGARSQVRKPIPDDA